MNYSASYRAAQLRKIQAALREARFELNRLLGSSSCAEIRSLDETILLVEDLRQVAVKVSVPAAPPAWAPHKIIP